MDHDGAVHAVRYQSEYGRQVAPRHRASAVHAGESAGKRHACIASSRRKPRNPPPSTIPLPSRLIPPTDPGHFEVRRINTAGTARLPNWQQFITRALNGEMIGLEEVRDGLWNVLYYDTLLGRFDERTRTITGAPSLKKDC